ncbi:hypothetical protein BJ956_003772, partial [Arthrobacter psychrochitiniphilus]|nr:hypothetical protein [Arthrobacter psychrochitiniphilus]
MWFPTNKPTRFTGMETNHDFTNNHGPRSVTTSKNMYNKIL